MNSPSLANIAVPDTLALDFFEKSFGALTGRTPFPWQKRAFLALASGHLPEQFSLPTGTGKTSLIPIWLCALAWQAGLGAVTLPRRLVWVVNRRVVVDQATDEAENMLCRLTNIPSNSSGEAKILSELARRLAGLSLMGRMGKAPVAISTLRGQMADNGEWKLDPSRPAIVVGTVDMIGSRLLFSGYGDGNYKRPTHAGLLGQDAWVVLDEAHLTPAFAELLGAIRKAQTEGVALGGWRYSLLSATQRGSGGQPFTLEADDHEDPTIGRRLRARKSLFIHVLEEKESEVERIAQLALRHKNNRCRVIVFVKSPEMAGKVAAEIGKEHDPESIRLLTGTQRGFERDELANDPIFSGFRSNPKRLQPEQTHYLVSTAAGEVGADLDADHLVCDLSPLDSLIQRFGRVNRLGLGQSVIDIVVSGKAEKEKEEQVRRAAALDYLRSLPKGEDGAHALSPVNMATPSLTAFSATPAVVPLAHHWLDMWSLTSISQADWRDRPEVAPWLHGVVDDLPETWVVWRDDVLHLADPKSVSDDGCAKALDAAPILPQEQLREPTYRIRDKLKKLAQQRGAAQKPIILLGTDGAVVWRKGTLHDLLEAEESRTIKLDFATLLLPTEIGGLSDQGVFEPKSDRASDKAEAGQPRCRFLLEGDVEGWDASPISGGEDRPTAHTEDSRAELIAAIAKAKGMKPVALIPVAHADDDIPTEEKKGRFLLYLAEAAGLADSSAKSFIAPRAEPLANHLTLVGRTARRLVERIAAPGTPLADLQEPIGQAGDRHDTGKGRSCWQRAIGNDDLDQPLAKSGHDRFNPRLNGGYRHEFGALLDAGNKLTDRMEHRELTLHLIATSHGNARPHFKEQAFDRESPLSNCREASADTLRRFGQLQVRYEWWGLAYLEAILKAADALVSAGLIADMEEK